MFDHHDSDDTAFLDIPSLPEDLLAELGLAPGAIRQVLDGAPGPLAAVAGE